MQLKETLEQELQQKSEYVNEIQFLKSQIEEMRQQTGANSPVSGNEERPKSPPLQQQSSSVSEAQNTVMTET